MRWLALLVLVAAVGGWYLGRRWLVLGELRAEVDPFRIRVPLRDWAHPVLAFVLVGTAFGAGVVLVLGDVVLGMAQAVLFTIGLYLVVRWDEARREAAESEGPAGTVPDAEGE